MDIQDRQHIGILASIDEAGGRDTVFINKGSYIQYRVKSLLLPQESPNFMSGFISSFEDDSEINDDEYSSEEERINNFEEAVKDKLFVYSYRVNGEGHANLGNGKTNLVKRPEKVTRDTYFYAVPVFSSKNNDTSREWELERKWSLFREYESKEEFIQFLKNKKSVGSTYGYYPDAFTPSFVIWLNDDGTMYAIGHVIENRYNMQGGLIIECDKIAIVNIDEFDEFWVYQASLNPTLMYIPENIYAKVEDKLSKAISVEKNGENVETDLQDSTDKKESTSVSTQNIKQEEQLIEIDVSEKTDDLIIKSMDYHSQKRNLFYNMKDFVNIHTALKCSSLVILSGLSGTGKSAIVDIYADAEEVELFLNGHSLGRKPAGEKVDFTATYKVMYEPGELLAVSYENGRETGRFMLSTAENEVELCVEPDKQVLCADGEDLSFITVKLIDKKGTENLFLSKKITVSAEGAGRIEAFGSADPKSLSEYDDRTWETFDGHVMAVVRAGMEEGTIKVCFEADGCKEQTVNIMVS